MRYLMIPFFLMLSMLLNAQDFLKLDTVLIQLQLEEEKCRMDLYTHQICQTDTNTCIILIPEIVVEDYLYQEYNSHILIVDTETGKIKSRYFESSETNEWYSDAISLDGIYVDTNLYYVTEDVQAFGIRVSYSGNSSPNPYSYESISLFIENDISIVQVLKNYEISSNAGEWDLQCEGEFTEKSRTLLISENQTNGFYDLLINTELKILKTFIDENGDCEEKETLSSETEVLKFSDGVYK